MSAMDEQVGGSHYKKGIQPFELSHANDHDGETHAIQKYLTRHHLKGGREDLLKAQHIVSIRLELIEKWGAFRPRREGIPIRAYCAANELGPAETAIVTRVEEWHQNHKSAHDVAAAVIRRMIHNLIESAYPQPQESE